ncbi:MAG: hypothetical protein CMJ18_28330 [Phycisphaeraceae bacterium]|nr:hypothetical protein [Phycisphaeraceae bacterium]
MNTKVSILEPRIMDPDLPAARRAAEEGGEPVFVPTQIYVDDRGWSIMNQMQGVLAPEGQVNYSSMYPGVVKAWHMHERQTDFWMCVHGDARAGIHRAQDGQMWMIVLGEHRPGILIVPNGLWHGVGTIGARDCGLLYYVTRAYDPQAPDEQRRPYDSVPGFVWEPSNR